MRTIIEGWFGVGLFVGAVIALIVGGLYLGFANPDDTDRRLLLNYWPFFAGTMILGFLGVILFFDAAAREADACLPRG